MFVWPSVFLEAWPSDGMHRSTVSTYCSTSARWVIVIRVFRTFPYYVVWTQLPQFGDRPRCILRLAASGKFSTRGRILRIYSKTSPAQRPVGPLRWNNFEESDPEWRTSKTPLIEECTFAFPRPVHVRRGFRKEIRGLRQDPKNLEWRWFR